MSGNNLLLAITRCGQRHQMGHAFLGHAELKTLQMFKGLAGFVLLKAFFWRETKDPQISTPCFPRPFLATIWHMRIAVIKMLSHMIMSAILSNALKQKA